MGELFMDGAVGFTKFRMLFSPSRSSARESWKNKVLLRFSTCIREYLFCVLLNSAGKR